MHAAIAMGFVAPDPVHAGHREIEAAKCRPLAAVAVELAGTSGVLLWRGGERE
jgi:hypothetical protein